MTETAPSPAPEATVAEIKSSKFRERLGYICVGGGLIGLLCLVFVPIPESNREPLLLALGIVLGWGGSVVSSEYGATATGRRVADSAIRRIEQQQDAGTGSGDTQDVNVVNTRKNPANVKDTPG